MNIFFYYPSYFIINNNNLHIYGDTRRILSLEKKISYDKDENINLIMDINESKYDECGDLCCKIYCALCCVSNCICCRAENSGISSLFISKEVMSTNFKDENIFNLIEQYKKKLDKLLINVKNNEWKINEINVSLENKDEIIDVITVNKTELEEKLETEPLSIIKELSIVYEKEKMNKQMLKNLEKQHALLLDENTTNRRDIYICREKINELYKYYAKCNLIK